MDNDQDRKPSSTTDPVDSAGDDHNPRPDSTGPQFSADLPAAAGRLFRLRSVIAVAAAGVVLGAAGGATVTALVDDDHSRAGHPSQRGEHGENGPGMPPGGQVPGIAPGDDNDDESAVPGGTSTS